MKVLLVNLARMGDLVQTTPAALGLQAERDARVSLLVTRNLAEFATQLAGIDEVIPFDEETLVPALLNRGHSLAEAERAWATWLEELRTRHFDLVINLTHDNFSARLVTMLGAPEVRGRALHRDGSFAIHGSWMRHFFVALNHRTLNPFNLADIYRAGAGVKGGAIAVQMKVGEPGAPLQERLSALPRPLVALHPGANHPHRRWPAERYGELAAKLAEHGMGSVVLGAPGEEELAAEVVEKSGGAAVSLAGLTTLEVLPALLANVDLLVTNDTGPLHVAAAVGTKTVSLFLAMARPEDTAPYAAGHLVFETLVATHPCPEDHPCPLPVCGSSIPVEAVRRACLQQLDLGEFQHDSLPAGTYRLLETGFGPDGRLALTEQARMGDEKNTPAEASDLRSLWLALHGDATDRQQALQARNHFSLHDRQLLLEAVELAEAIQERLFGTGIVDDLGNPLTLAALERDWLELEQRAGTAAALMLAFRLEREWLYTRGLDTAREEAGKRFQVWISTVRGVIGARSGAEAVV